MRRILCICLCICILLLCGCAESTPENTSSCTEPETTEQTAPLETRCEDTQPAETEAEQPLPTEEPEPEPTHPPDPVDEVLNSMTIVEKVGQLFLARCPDINAVDDISAYHLGGYILFGRDFDSQTPDSFREKIESYQAAAAIPLLIAVDEEGGTVTRVSSHAAFRSSKFRSPRALYDENGMQLVLETEQEKCTLLASLGINVNMAPVCDITTDSSAFMYSRSLGQDAQTTASYIEQVVTLMEQNHIGSVLKHFPGYGNNADTHVGIAIDRRSVQDLQNNDLVPFEAGMHSNCGAVLVSHTIIADIDDQYPASLSPAVHRMIREDMGYEGVILTDDLAMQAITKAYGTGEAAVLAVQAGNDLLCSSHYQEQYKAVLDAVQDGRISEAQIDEAALRVIRWKMDLDLPFEFH